MTVCMEATGEVLAEQRATLTAEFAARLEREIAKLRAEFLEQERGAKR